MQNFDYTNLLNYLFSLHKHKNKKFKHLFLFSQIVKYF